MPSPTSRLFGRVGPTLRKHRVADPIVYIDRSTIRDGKTAEVADEIQRLVGFIQSREPQLLAYEFCLDESGTNLTVIAIHPDSASLETHLEVGRSAFQQFSELIDLQSINVYGRPSDKVLKQLEDKASMLGDHGSVEVHPVQHGFSRLAHR